MDSEIGFWITAIGGLLLGAFAVAKQFVDRMAARPKEDGWDKAKEKLDKIAPLIDRWNDPSDPAVPKSPPEVRG